MNTNGVPQMWLIGSPLATNGGINLPASAASGVGVIFQSGAPNTFIHSFGGVTNFFAGNQAGNLVMAGTNNTGVGHQALFSNASGIFNTAIGSVALFSNMSGN